MKTFSIHQKLKLQNDFRKIIFGIFCMIISASGIMIAQISHSVNFIRENYSCSSKIALDSNNYYKISLKDLDQSCEIGNPELPVKYINLLIPPDQEVANIVIAGKQDAEIPGSFMVFPVQYPVPTKDGELPPFVKPNSATYSSDELFPSEIVQVIHDGYFDGSNHIITLAIYPVQYKPKSGKLIFHLHLLHLYLLCLL